jgi:thioredoxin reductase
MYLAKCGHNVTVMTNGRELVTNSRVHYPSEIIDAYKRLDNLTPLTDAVATAISKGKVTYEDAKGKERSILADDVVVYSGTRPRKDEALKFYGSAKRFFIIGECNGVGFGVQKTIRNAFFAASQI